MTMNSLDDLFKHFLADIYYAEKKMLTTVPKLSEKASFDTLSNFLNTHADEVQKQVDRLENVFETIGQKPKGEQCPAINGIIEETDEIVGECKDEQALDAAIVAALQAGKHYGIARYGTLVSWAKLLGNDSAKTLLQQNLDNEYDVDRELTSLAEVTLNKKAA